MKLFAGIIILTILIVFFIYFSKNRNSMNMKKQLKETFIDSSSLASTAFSETILISDAEIQEKEQEIKQKREDLDLLQENLITLTHYIDEKRRQLTSLRTADAVLNSDLDNLGIFIDKLNSDIKKFSDAVFVKEPTPIDIFTLTQVKARKDTIHSEIEALKTKINDALIHYDEADISTIQQIGDIQTGLIKDLNDVRMVYDRVYKVLKKNTSFMEICSSSDNSLDGYPGYVVEYINTLDRDEICRDIDVTNLETNFNDKTELNYELGSNICSSKKGTCIYERDGENGGPKSYHTDTFDYKFYRHRWPQEDSCEAQSNACFSFGTLSDRACDGDIKTLYFTKENDKAVYYSSNVGYRSIEISPGNWECIVDYSSPWIDSEDTIAQTASNNCELNNNKGYGVASYDCYSVTLDEINPTKSNLNTKSKTWRNTLNIDGSIGKCVIDETCRTQNDANAHVQCLKEDYSSTGNFQCHTLSDDGLSATPGQYRNTYALGTWNSETNKMELGVCSTTTTGECRTKQDVEAEIACLNTDNWSCAAFNFQPHASNIGSVEVIENTGQKRNTYTKLDYMQLDNTNQGEGTCSINNSCLSPTDLQEQADCHNSVDNYRCWTVNGTTHNANQTENRMFKNWSDNECKQDDSCMNMDIALSTAEEACHASQSDRCYKIDDTVTNTNDDGSKNIIYDEGDTTNQYPNGRKTQFTITDTNGTCSKRVDCASNLNALCSSLTVNCYSSENGLTPTQMVYNNKPENMKCVPPEGCSLIPHCSYMTVRTGNSNVFKTEDIGKVDCSEGNAYGKMYAWNLESTSMESINNPGGFSRDYGKWTAIMEEDNVENTLCVRDASKMNTSPLTGLSEENVDFVCSACPFESLSSDEGWTSNIVEGTENKEGRLTIPEDTVSDVYVLINDGTMTDGITYVNDGRSITYNTKAVVSDGNCPDPRDVSVLNTSDYDQKVVYKHTRILQPDVSSGDCFGKTKHEIKYTLEPHGGRCVFDCMQYFDDSDMETTCYSKVEFQNHNSGGDINYTEATCGQSGKRFPSRKIREGRNGGRGCTGNPTNGETLQEFYNEKMGKGVDCSMPACACTESDYSAWAPPPGDTTPADWNREASSVPCDKTYTHTRTLSSDCDNSTTSLNETETITHAGGACCTPSDGIVSNWSSCPLCVESDQTATQTQTTTGKTVCQNGMTVSVADSSETRNCDPQPPTCGPISGTRRIKSSETCTPNAVCDWTLSSPSRAGTRPAEIKYNIQTGTGTEWQDDGTIACTVTCTMPQAPTDLSATNITHNSFELSWNPDTDNGDATLSNYTILLDGIATTPTVTSTPVVIDRLSPNKNYSVSVRKNFDLDKGPTNGVTSNPIEVTTKKTACTINDQLFIFNGFSNRVVKTKQEWSSPSHSVQLGLYTFTKQQWDANTLPKHTTAGVISMDFGTYNSNCDSSSISRPESNIETRSVSVLNFKTNDKPIKLINIIRSGVTLNRLSSRIFIMENIDDFARSNECIDVKNGGFYSPSRLTDAISNKNSIILKEILTNIPNSYGQFYLKFKETFRPRRFTGTNFEYGTAIDQYNIYFLINGEKFYFKFPNGINNRNICFSKDEASASTITLEKQEVLGQDTFKIIIDDDLYYGKGYLSFNSWVNEDVNSLYVRYSEDHLYMSHWVVVTEDGEVLGD